ncbi:MAG: hypothetical protein LBS94_05725 [Prevotellaceae bacterium]|nr:hypothetical protein [Prevotellaceae bacterium]
MNSTSKKDLARKYSYLCSSFSNWSTLLFFTMYQPLFDYLSAAKAMQIPAAVVQDLEAQVQQEFPNDAMLMELHVLRALNAYASKHGQAA